MEENLLGRDAALTATEEELTKVKRKLTLMNYCPMANFFKQSIILNKVNLKVKSVEEDLEKQNEKLISTSEKVKSAITDNSKEMLQ